MAWEDDSVSPAAISSTAGTDLRARARAAYVERWGEAPERLLFAPGRINLIGDHTDYSLLPVLPMAIQRGIAFAVGPGEPGVVIDSLDEPSEFRTGCTAERPASWHRYADAALRALGARDLRARVLLVGDLPRTGGLSSSSALVVGLLASLARDPAVSLRGDALVDTAVAAERLAAIEGGRMDQTVIVFAQAGGALRIDFEPPSKRVVPIPPGLAFIAADSGERAAKGGAARDRYNAAVVGCRVAAALLAHRLGRPRPAPLVLGALAGAPPDVVGALPESTTPALAAGATGTPIAELVGFAAEDFPSEVEVRVRDVARHVLDEAAAVDAAEARLRAADLPGFGRLLNASHRSLQRFGSTTPALDRLTGAMTSAGALGARVTGAGFGGFAIAACEEDRVEPVLAAARAATGGPAFVVIPTAGVG